MSEVNMTAPTKSSTEPSTKIAGDKSGNSGSGASKSTKSFDHGVSTKTSRDRNRADK